MTKPSDLPNMIGQEMGLSKWFEIDQARINAFADATEDWQFIHVDPEAAAKTIFRSTIAHGFLTLSLLSRFGEDAFLQPPGVRMGVNYGFDKVRFIAPVKSGKRVRGRFFLKSADERKPRQWEFHHDVTVEIEGEDKPALTAEWIGVIFV